LLASVLLLEVLGRIVIGRSLRERLLVVHWVFVLLLWFITPGVVGRLLLLLRSSGELGNLSISN